MSNVVEKESKEKKRKKERKERVSPQYYNNAPYAKKVYTGAF